MISQWYNSSIGTLYVVQLLSMTSDKKMWNLKDVCTINPKYISHQEHFQKSFSILTKIHRTKKAQLYICILGSKCLISIQITICVYVKMNFNY